MRTWVLQMVFGVYGHGPQVQLADSATVRELIERVRPSGSQQKFGKPIFALTFQLIWCLALLYQGQAQDPGLKLSELPGLRPNHVLRVVQDVRTDQPMPVLEDNSALALTLDNLKDHERQAVSGKVMWGMKTFRSPTIWATRTSRRSSPSSTARSWRSNPSCWRSSATSTCGNGVWRR